MSAATDALIAPAVCVQQCIPEGYHVPVLISLFAQIAGMSTPLNTNALMAGAVCIEQCIPPGMRLPVLISLAQQILATGGVGAGAGQSCLVGIAGSGSPSAAAPCPVSLAVNEIGQLWFWQTPGNVWQPLIQ